MADRHPDRDRIEALLSALTAAVAELARVRHRVASFEDFRGDSDTRELCVPYLRIALECVLETCRHYLAAVGVSLHEVDTTNLIELAGDKGLLEGTFARRIRGMAGLRNAIVHMDGGSTTRPSTERSPRQRPTSTSSHGRCARTSVGRGRQNRTRWDETA